MKKSKLISYKANSKQKKHLNKQAKIGLIHDKNPGYIFLVT